MAAIEISPNPLTSFTLDSDKWIFCKVCTQNEETALPFKEQSWATLKNRANIFRDKIYDLIKHIDEPMGKYHKRCYTTYTHKKKLKQYGKSELQQPST